MKKLLIALGLAALLSACQTQTNISSNASKNGAAKGTVYFATGSAEISHDGVTEIEGIVSTIRRNWWKEYHPYVVELTGHTDTVGNASLNQALSKRRVDAVAAELVGQGIDPRLIKIDYEGETNNAVSAGDNVNEQENRRVDIRAYQNHNKWQ